MAFIYGIIDFDNKNRSSEDIEKLGFSVGHEGFDCEIVYQKNGIYLGFTYRTDRKIESPFYETEAFVVLAEGRIFNHEELSMKLNYTSDASCFLEAFNRWGKDAANYINGEFAVIIIDKQTNEVNFFRDHIGVRSLAHYYDEKQLVIASHPFGIAKSKLVPFEYNVHYFLDRFFSFKGEYQRTYFSSIERSLPGIHFTANTTGIIAYNYWKTNEIVRVRRSREEVVSTLRKNVRKAIEERLKHHTQVGTHMSGGLDSSGVSSLVSECLNNEEKSIFGYSWSPRKERIQSTIVQSNTEEYDFIQKVSIATNIPVYFVDKDPRVFTESALMPEFETMSIEHPMMEKAQEDGISIMFSGFGGDEFLSLSNRGMVNHLFFTFQWRKLLKLMAKGKYKMVISRFSKEIMPEFFSKKKKIFRKLMHENRKFFDNQFWISHEVYLKSRIVSSNFAKNRNTFIQNLMELYHIPKRLDTWCYFGEKYGIEYSYPLLDKQLLDEWFSIPLEYTYDLETSRKLFRDVFEGILIDEVRLRNSKAEHERVQFTMDNRISELDYLIDKVKKVEKNSFLAFINQETLIVSVKQMNVDKERTGVFFGAVRLLFYLKECVMSEKYY